MSSRFLSFNTQKKKPKEEGKKKARIRHAAYRKKWDGTIQMAHTTQLVAEDMAVAVKSKPERVDAYFREVFSKRPNDCAEAFHQTLLQTRCFYCEDTGTIGLKVETKRGFYDYAFRCTCQDNIEHPVISESVESIQVLIERELFSLSCKLGGTNGEHCPLQKKEVKCIGVNCPKFK